MTKQMMAIRFEAEVLRIDGPERQVPAEALQSMAFALQQKAGAWLRTFDHINSRGFSLLPDMDTLAVLRTEIP